MAFLTDAVVGIDLGGTKTRVGLFTFKPCLETVDLEVLATSQSPQKAVGDIGSSIGRMGKKGYKVVGVGFAAPGPYDETSRKFSALPNLPCWKDFPLQETMENAFGVPVIMENDANAAALGEYLFGAGAGCKNMLYVTVGTGVGGSFIQDGEIYRGRCGNAGEIGHVTVEPGGALCGCGKRGCLETVASGPAIARAYGSRTEEVFLAASQGDTEAVSAVMRAGGAIGKCLATLIAFLAPDRIVFGGGVMSGIPGVVATYVESAKRCSEEYGSSLCPPSFRLSTHKDLSGVLGAAHLARRVLVPESVHAHFSEPPSGFPS